VETEVFIACMVLLATIILWSTLKYFKLVLLAPYVIVMYFLANSILDILAVTDLAPQNMKPKDYN